MGNSYNNPPKTSVLLINGHKFNIKQAAFALLTE